MDRAKFNAFFADLKSQFYACEHTVFGVSGAVSEGNTSNKQLPFSQPACNPLPNLNPLPSSS